MLLSSRLATALDGGYDEDAAGQRITQRPRPEWPWLAAFAVTTAVVVGLFWGVGWDPTKSDPLPPTDSPGGELPGGALAANQDEAPSTRITDQLLKELGPFENREVQKMKMHRALERDLAAQIRMLDVADTVEVRLNTRESRGMRQQASVEAIVMITPRNPHKLATHWLHSIRTIVAGGHLDLSEAQVQIVDIRSGRVYTAANNSGEHPDWMDEFDRKTLLEQHWSEKIRSVLRPLGDEFYELTVNVEPAADGSPTSPSALSQDRIAACVVIRTQVDPAGREQRLDRVRLKRSLESLHPGLTAEVLSVPWGQRSQPASPTVESNPLHYLSTHGGTVLVAAVVGIVGMLILAIWLLPKHEPSTPAVASAETPQEAPDVAVLPQTSRQHETDEQEVALVEQVGSLVRKDPSTAAQVIQDWMRKAG